MRAVANFADRIDCAASAEAVFQSFRRWTLDEHGLKVPAMPIYNFGHLLNVVSSHFIGPAAFQIGAQKFIAIADTHGWRLPHPFCGFLNRYSAANGHPEYMILAIAQEQAEATIVQWYQWDRKHDWHKTSEARFSFAEGINYRLMSRHPTASLTFWRNAHLTALSCGLYLIFERGGAVQAEALPPAVTKGRDKVHPFAPSSVITIRVDVARLLRPAAVPVQSSNVKTSKCAHNRSAATPHYRHPRFKNVRGTIGYRNPAKVHGGVEQAKIYQIDRT